MIDLQFFLEKRMVYGKTQWAIRAKIGTYEGWIFETWDKKPFINQIENAKRIFIRGMEFQHRHMRLPAFDYKIHDIRDFTGELK